MATSYTSLLGLALPTTGELQGTWGDTVNNSITSLLDSAVAGTTTLSTDLDVTLTTTTGAANQSRQAILLCSGARTAVRTITAPAQSKIYTVINNTTGGFAVKLVGVGPTTGVTIPAGTTAQVAWNGSDFVDVSGYVNGNLTVNGNVTVNGNTTLKGNTSIGDATSDTLSVTSTITSNLLFTDNTYDIGASGATRPRSIFLAGNATVGGLTSGRLTFAGTGGLLSDSSNLTWNGTTLSVVGRLYNGDASTFGASTWAMSLGNGGVSANYFKASTTYWQTDAGSQIAQLNNGGLTLTTNLLFNADNTYDIGASGATRPRNLYLSNNGVIGSTLAVGKSSASQVLDVSSSDTTAYAASSSSLIQPAGGSNASVANTGTGGYASLRFTALDSSNAVGYIGFANAGGSVTGNFVIGQRTGTSAYAEQLRLMPNSVIQLDDSAGSYRSFTKDATSPGIAIKSSIYGALGGPVCGDWSVNAYPTGTPDPAYVVWKGTVSGAYAYLNEINGNYGFTWLVSTAAVTAGSAFTWGTGMVLDNNRQLGVGLYPKTWYGNRKAIEVGGAAVATLALTPTISEIMTNLYYNTSGTPINYGAGFLSTVEFNNAVSGGWAWKQGYNSTAGTTSTLTTFMNLDSGGNLNLGVGNNTASSRLNVYTSTTPVGVSGNYGAGATIQSGTGTFSLTGAAPRGIGVLINSNQNNNITIPYGGSYENIGLMSAAQFVAGGAYTTYAVGAYAKSDGSAYAIRADAVTTSSAGAAIGLYIGSSSGSSNQNYGIYQYDANNGNYFAGPISIGSSQVTNTTQSVFLKVGTGSGSVQNWIWAAGNATGLPTGATYGVLMAANLSQGSSEGNIVYGTGIGSGQGLTFGSWNGSSYSEKARFDYYGNFLVGLAGRTNGVSNSFGTVFECHGYAGSVSMSGSTWVALLTLTASSFTCADIIIQGSENGNVNTYFAKWCVTYAAGGNGWAISGPHQEVTSGNGYGQCNMRVNGNNLEVQARNGVSSGIIRYHVRYFSA